MSVLAQLLGIAEAQPDHAAVKDMRRELTYENLVREVANAASGLLGMDIRPRDRVVIRMSTSIDALVVALGCMWIGALFVPISPTDPIKRLATILEDCQPRLVVSTADENDIPRGQWDQTTFEDMVEDNGTLLAPPNEQGPAYCIYTSGTTGAPKGVVVGQESFSHAIRSTIDALNMNSTTKTLCISAFHFDGSFASLFSTLCAGGTLTILRREPMVLPRTYVRTIKNERINTAFCPPSFLRLILSSESLGEFSETSLSKIVFGGEQSVARHLLALFSAIPNVRLYNLYGPTETVVDVAIHEITPNELNEGEVLIGRPHPGVVFRLFDEQDHEITVNDTSGELYIGGSQLMEGYWADPDLSIRVLRRDLDPGAVLYRTGDLVKRKTSGDFVYLGRIDRVVKRTGVRISLDEIEKRLRQLPGVTNAACFAISNAEATKIHACASVEPGVAPKELASKLAEELPKSMIPDTIDTIDMIPLTAAGKVDYHALAKTYAR